MGDGKLYDRFVIYLHLLFGPVTNLATLNNISAFKNYY